MAKVFIGIALVFMLATAGIGFALKGNVDKLQQTLTKTKGQVTTAEGAARAAKSEADKAQKEAKEAADKADAAAKTAAEKTQEADKAKMDLMTANTVIESNKAKIDELNDKIAKNPGGPDPTVMAAKDAQIAELTTKVDNTSKERDEAKMALDQQVAKAQANEQAVADLKKQKKKWEDNIMKPGLQGRILAVNSGWNFVVLSVGDKQGVVMNATLLVVRGGEPIARLRITSVEPSTSIADVLPGTMRRGTTIQPGDTVIFEGTRNQTPSKSAPDIVPTVPPITPTVPGLPLN